MSLITLDSNGGYSNGDELAVSTTGTGSPSNKMLRAYQAAINELDDYFEYRFESDKDQEFVYDVLDRLTNKLKE